MPLIVDSHEDLAWNMLSFGRDYSRSVAETRRLEKGSPTINQNDNTMLGWPDFQRGQVAVVFSTLFAAPIRQRVGEWESLVYTDVESAHHLYWNQLVAYHRLVDSTPDKFRLVQSVSELNEILDHWTQPGTGDGGHPVGLVISMEGADGIRTPDELNEWWSLGLRIIGLAWAGTRFCGGTKEPGPLTDEGRTLLSAMADFNFTLDLSHMDEEAALQSLDTYPGPIVVTHGNASDLLRDALTNRHLTDRVINGVIERDGVIGAVPYNKFLKVGWDRTDGRQMISLDNLVTHIDHICQLAGDPIHVGIGSDFDGGFGLEAAPNDVDTIADLQKLAPKLSARGYSESDIAAVFSGNWINHLRQNFPGS